MDEKSKTDQYVGHLNSHILPFIDYGELQASYGSDMSYAKGILNRLHEAMISVYGSETLDEYDGDDGFVVIPGVLRGRESGKVCLALLELDLSSSGEHWGTSYLCKNGVISQDGTEAVSNNDSVLKSEIREINAAYLPYDYCYTASIPDDIHIDSAFLPEELKAVLNDFRNHREELLFEEDSIQDKTAQEDELFDRLDRNCADIMLGLKENISRRDLKNQDFVILAEKITTVWDAYRHLKDERIFSDEEVKYLLEFQNPLKLISDKWPDKIDGFADMSDVVDNILEDRNSHNKYAKTADASNPAAKDRARRVTDKEKESVLDRIRGAAKTPKEPRKDKTARNKSENEH